MHELLFIVPFSKKIYLLFYIYTFTFIKDIIAKEKISLIIECKDKNSIQHLVTSFEKIIITINL